MASQTKSFLAALFLVMGLCAPNLRPQYTTASLGGTVLDASGAVVPEAAVTLRNIETGLMKATRTATNGSFLLPGLTVGEYRLTVEKAGFSTYVREGIKLAVDQAAALTVTLEVGQAAQQVTVLGDVNPISTREATIGQTIDQTRVIDLPLNGRQVQSLVFLAAGTTDLSDRYCGVNCEGGTYPGQQQAGVSGSGPGGVNYQLDGAGHNDVYLNANLPFPNPDAIQEFRLEANNLSAVYGDGAAVVNVVSKSGTNELHFDLFEFLRNGKLNARNFFAADQDSLKRNQFGGSAGGPMKKDKLFFFGTYQGTRIRTAPGGQIAFVPTAAERSGDFSDVLPGTQLVDPVSGAPYANNQIPAGQINPVAQYFLKYIPLPNGPDRQLTYVGGAQVQNEDQFTGKIDYNAGAHVFSGRYFFTNFDQPAVISKTNLLQDANTGNKVRVQTVSINHRYASSPNLLFNTWIGYHRQIGGSLSSAPFSFADAGVSIAAPTPPELRVNVGGGFGINTNHIGDFNRTGWTIREGVTLVKGNHQFQFGGEAVRIGVNVRNTYHQSGLFQFSNQLTGDNVADFLVGRATFFLQGGGEFLVLNGTKWSAFLQDDWKINDRLVLNLGLRWDPYFPFTEDKGRIVCFLPGVQSARYPNAPLGMVFGGSHHDPGCPANGSNANAGNFAPRLGFAYRLTGDGKTSLKGGVGIYYSTPATAGYTNFADNAPFSPQFGLSVVNFSDPFGSAGIPNPFPAQYAPNIPTTNAAFTLPTTITLAFQPDYRLPAIATWNLTIERELAKNWLVRAAYVANKGTHLYQSDFKGYGQLNPAIYIPGNSSEDNTQQRRIYQNFGSIGQLGSYNNSNYNSLQLTVEKRLGLGFSILGNYTWSKNMDDFAPEGPAFGNYGLTNPFNRHFDYGRSDDDIAHQFHFSGVWQIPHLSVTGPANSLLNGWELTGIWTWRGGFPLSIYSGLDNSFSAQGQDRADLIKGGNPQLSSGRSHGAQVAEFFDTTFFGPNAIGTYGSSGKNNLRGPRMSNVDASLLKRFTITERFALQFRAEFFNLFNNVNFAPPQTGLLAIDNIQSDESFGQILAAGAPRTIQFALKLIY
jgi:hypothetical protein